MDVPGKQPWGGYHELVLDFGRCVGGGLLFLLDKGRRKRKKGGPRSQATASPQPTLEDRVEAALGSGKIEAMTAILEETADPIFLQDGCDF
jgi:hypothetical protein